MANDLLSALRTYLTKVTGGEKTPQELAAALNAWARESSEAIKVRVEDEIQRSAKKMGFAKQSDVDKLARELEELRFKLVGGARPTQSTKKKSPKSSTSSKSAPKKKSAAKKSSPSTSRTKKK